MSILNRKKKTFEKRGACSLVFDDCYKETLVNILPILKKYNLKATFAFATNYQSIEKTEKIPCASLEIMRKIKILGHEIASHTVTHRNLTTLNNRELEKELRDSKNIIDTQTIIYPGGKSNLLVLKKVKKIYQFGRGVEEKLNPIPPKNFLDLASIVPNKNTNWKKLEANAKRAAKKNLWLIESYHLISVNQGDYKFTVTPEQFEAHLQKLINLNLWIAPILTIGNYIQKKANHLLPK